MSELELREFASRAEELVPLPDLAELEHRGRDLHRRRVAAGTALAAVVLAAAGMVAIRDDAPRSVEPIKPPDSTGAQPYPGAVMETLDRGTYTMDISSDPLFPVARVTLPRGWNAWQGPNRFEERDGGQSEDESLGELEWYVGVLVVDVDAVSSRLCVPPQIDDEVGPTAASLVRAIRGIPGFRVLVDTVPDSMFGHPATHLRLVTTPALGDCDTNLFDTTANGVVGGFADTEDVWVVDVAGDPVLVDSQRSDGTPPRIQRQLEEVVESIEFHPSEPATDD
ncbi:hypothetical protein ACT8ZV_16260 [Nocardioides sp. MAHUQ-72]|uniref:hypothetical protein n=1 Tax=unclassified Nocardioides TaxID=2615069 RepID=UPI00361A2641